MLKLDFTSKEFLLNFESTSFIKHLIEQLSKINLFNFEEIEMTKFFIQDKNLTDPIIALTIILLMYLERDGQAQLEVDSYAAKVLEDEKGNALTLPSKKVWMKALLYSPDSNKIIRLVNPIFDELTGELIKGPTTGEQALEEQNQVGQPEKKWGRELHKKEDRLIILDEEVLYLQKYYSYLNGVLDFVKGKVKGKIRGKIRSETKTTPFALKRVVEEKNWKSANWLNPDWFSLDWSKLQSLNLEQKLALWSSFRNDISVISGGPGTGKTYLVYHILKEHLKQQGGGRAEEDTEKSIAVLAPTGKAANRLKEAILKEATAQEHSDISHSLFHGADADETANETDLKVKQKLFLISEQVSTIHKFLVKNSRANWGNKPYLEVFDLVVIDEFSMISYSLLYFLLKKISAKKIIFIGDHRQLPSLDCGNLMKDLVGKKDNFSYTKSYLDEFRQSLLASPFNHGESPGELEEKTLEKNLEEAFSKKDVEEGFSQLPPHPWKDCLTELKNNYRQSGSPILQKISQAVAALELEQGDGGQGYADFYSLIKSGAAELAGIGSSKENGKESWQWIEEFDEVVFARVVSDAFLEHYRNWFDLIHSTAFSFPPSDEEILGFLAKEPFKQIQKKIMLTPINQGLYSNRYIELTLENLLTQNNILNLPDNLSRKKLSRGGDYLYSGKPILITSNNYELEIFNGDVGIIFSDLNYDANKDNQAKQPGASGSSYVLVERKNALIPLSKIKNYETFYSLTIHKSQGSEFEEGVIVLPTSKEFLSKDFLSRELFYTALTRFKKKITLLSIRESLEKTLRNSKSKTSFLEQAVWQS